MSQIVLQYGQKVLFPTNPIRYIVSPGFGVSNSDEVEMAEFTVDKYWGSDKNANTYKVKLTPVDKSGRIPYEHVYSDDLKKMIRDGRVQLIN